MYIDTPPNLIISGLYTDETGTTMNVLATTIPGLFCLGIGVLSIIAMRKLLPDRKTPETAFEDTSEYTVELMVPSDNPNIGKRIAEAGLKDIHGGKLIEVIHFDEVISPVPDDEPIMGG